MLAENKLGGKPVIVDVFVVEDDDAFPITLIRHTQQSLERLIISFPLRPTLELGKNFPLPSDFIYYLF